jgi:hypothetical protein
MIRKVLFTKWYFMRWLRLCLGIYFIIEALNEKDPLLGFISAFFLFQAVTNTGCVAGKCSIQNGEENLNAVKNNVANKIE